MSTKPALPAPAQIRAGRALIGWSQEQLAQAASVGIVTVRHYEDERRPSVPGALGDIRSALEREGVQFTPSSETHGPGVRLIGRLPTVLRRPLKKGEWDEYIITVEWRTERFEIYLSRETLEDLGEFDGDAPTAERSFIELLNKYRQAILKAAALKIDAKQVAPDRRVHLSDAEIRNASIAR